MGTITVLAEHRQNPRQELTGAQLRPTREVALAWGVLHLESPERRLQAAQALARLILGKSA